VTRNRRRLSSYVAFLFLLVPLAAEDEAQGARVFLEGEARAAFLARLAERLSERVSFVADFTQEKRLAVFRDTVRSSGFLLFVPPDRLRWEISTPFRSILLVNGKDVAKFEFVDDKRRELELGRARDAVLVAMERLQGWLRGNFEEQQKQYVVRISIEPTALIVLTPRDEAMRRTVRAIEFEPAADLRSMARVTIRERSGDFTTLTFANRTAGVRPDAAVFALEDPADVDLTALRATASR
jgi:outer membrane lipoprotein-sorting protein